MINPIKKILLIIYSAQIIYAQDNGFSVAHTLFKGEKGIRSIAFCSNGARLASATSTQVVVHDVTDGENISKYQSEDIIDMAISPDDEKVAIIADNKVRILDSHDLVLRAGSSRFRSPLYSLAFIADSTDVVACDSANILYISSATAETIVRHPVANGIRSVACSPDGKWVSVGSPYTHDVHLLKITPDGLHRSPTRRSHLESVYAVKFDPTNRLLASSSVDKTISLWDIRVESRPALILNGHRGTVYSVAWRTDTTITSGSADNTVRVWDLRAATIASVVLPVKKIIRSVACDYSTGRIAAGTSNGEVLEWGHKA